MYDTFLGLPLASFQIKITPNERCIWQKTYSSIPGVHVENLRIDQGDLNTRRMMDLMAVKSDEGSMPLYLHAVNRIIRELRLAQQQKEVDGQLDQFDYGEFKRMLEECPMTPAQLAPLRQRLDTLESFMPTEQTIASTGASTGASQKKGSSRSKMRHGNDWSVKVLP